MLQLHSAGLRRQAEHRRDIRTPFWGRRDVMADPARTRTVLATPGLFSVRVSASAPVGPGRVPLARRTPRRGALLPGGERSAPTEPAGETLDGIEDATRTPQASLPCPRKRAPPFGASVRKGQPQSWAGDFTTASAAASGAIACGACAPSAAFFHALRAF